MTPGNARKFEMRSSVARCAVAVVLASAAVSAHAQDAATIPPNETAIAPSATIAPNAAAANDTNGDKVKVEDIVVTGTLIRGAAPTGGEVVTITSNDIAQLGVSNTSQLLGSLPQDANFNSRPQTGSYGPYQSVNAPILRYLGGGSSGSNSTLLLVDGVRLPGMGISQTSSDIDSIAPAALERVETATDGGSATYGADAVGGVVNLITRKRFDGLQVDGHYGGASNYRQYDGSVTAGKIWNTGSIWVSYQYAHNDALAARDRDYVHDLNYTTTPFTGNSFACNPGNFIAGGYVAIPTPPYYALQTTTYPIVNGAPVTGTPNTCDHTQGTGSLFPEMTRHSVFAGGIVDLSDWLTFDFKAFYTHRETVSDGGYNVYTGVPATACTGGTAICSGPYAPYFTTSGTVSGSFEPSFGPHTYAKATLDTWAVVPRLTAKLGHDWQLVAFLNVGDGFATSLAPSSGGDAVALATEVANGSFNPFTGLFANTPAGQAAQTYQQNYYGYATGKDTITNARAVFDGPLFKLPGGDVRAAIGGEFLHERFTQRNGLAELGEFDLVPHTAARSVKSVFGELSVPIVGEDNRFAGIYSLTVTAAGRYDHYSDFGGTFNPKIGAALKPTSWWTLRGNWSKSFQAPSLASTAAVIPPAVVSFPAGTFGANPAYPNTSGLTTLLLYPGGGINLRPQKARTWEVGTDIRPTFVPGFSASVTYYNIDFRDKIDTPAFYLSSFYSLYPNSYIMNTPAAPLTSAQIAQYIGAGYNAAQFQQYVNNPGTVYALENGLSQNLSSVKTSGIDFDVNYTLRTGFGSIFAGVAGTYVLTYNTRATPTSSVQGIDPNGVQQLRTQTTLGTTIGPLLAKATWNRTDGFAVQPTAGNAYQSHVKAFNVFNLAFQFAPKWEGALKDTAVTLNVDNLLDTDPPVLNGGNGNAHGYYGFTLGRLLSIGIKKAF